MVWGEIDWQERVWTVPAARMKNSKKHRVPLSVQALAKLMRQRILLARQHGFSDGMRFELDPNGYIWPGRSGNAPITGKSAYKYLTQTMGMRGKATVHGMRSTFRDWAGDMTHYARNDIEECLSHAVGDATERAYRRSDSLEKRRVIYQAWADYCA
jgi:integrase